MSEQPKNIVVQAGKIVVNLSPLGFHRYAKEYYRAAESFQVTNDFSPVPYYLYCRSIELLLKAFLMLKGVEKTDLKRRFGHNLKKILIKAKKLNIEELYEISTDEGTQLEKANKYYARKGFEYFFVTDAVTRYQALPDIGTLKLFSERLIEKLYELCLRA